MKAARALRTMDPKKNDSTTTCYTHFSANDEHVADSARMLSYQIILRIAMAFYSFQSNYLELTCTTASYPFPVELQSSEVFNGSYASTNSMAQHGGQSPR